MAGWPLNRSFSVSASLAAAKADRSVLQKRHLSATALMVSPQTGQGLVSSSMMNQVYTFRRGRMGQRGHAATARHCQGNGRIIKSDAILRIFHPGPPFVWRGVRPAGDLRARI